MKEVHPLTQVIPTMADGSALVMNIAHHGQEEPIWLYEGKIIEGRIRYPACLEAGVTPQFRHLPVGTDPMDFIVQRHMDSWNPDHLERLKILVSVIPYYKRKKGPFAPRLSRVTGLGQHTIRKVNALYERGKVDKVISGELSLNDAMRKAGLQNKYGVDRAKTFGYQQFGRGDRFDDTAEPFRRYLAAWRKKGFEFTHVNPKEATRRVKMLNEMLEDIKDALADLEPRSIRPKHIASPERRK